MSDLDSERGSGNGNEWVISRTPSVSRPRRDPETKFQLIDGRWDVLLFLTIAASSVAAADRPTDHSEIQCLPFFRSAVCRMMEMK
eukprot:scaffold2473_cov214-Chaetoceros_neogracile.AAC.6